MTLAPEGRHTLRVEARNAAVPIEKSLSGLKPGIDGPEYNKLKTLVRSGERNTVCEEAGCPTLPMWNC